MSGFQYYFMESKSIKTFMLFLVLVVILISKSVKMVIKKINFKSDLVLIKAFHLHKIVFFLTY